MKKYILIFLLLLLLRIAYIYVPVFTIRLLWGDNFGYNLYWLLLKLNFWDFILPLIITIMVYLFDKFKINKTKYISGIWMDNIRGIWIGLIILGEISKPIIFGSENSCTVGQWVQDAWAIIELIEVGWMIIITVIDLSLSRWRWFLADILIIAGLYVWFTLSQFAFMCG